MSTLMEELEKDPFIGTPIPGQSLTSTQGSIPFENPAMTSNPEEAFKGFSHPAVITVALVLLISKGLERSGFISVIGRKLQAYANSEIQFMISITFFAAILSSFMNNIGAMAMLLPITLGICQKMNWNPSKFLIPLSFASILGGMNTKIGTPPNIIISEFRNDFEILSIL